MRISKEALELERRKSYHEGYIDALEWSQKAIEKSRETTFWEFIGLKRKK